MGDHLRQKSGIELLARKTLKGLHAALAHIHRVLCRHILAVHTGHLGVFGVLCLCKWRHGNADENAERNQVFHDVSFLRGQSKFKLMPLLTHASGFMAS